MKSGVGVAVRAGAPRPDISSADALKRALLAAKSLGYSQGPSGVYIEGLFQRMGIADALKPKSKQTQPGNPVGVLIARGEVEIGFQQISELLRLPASTISGRCRRTFSTSPCSRPVFHTSAKEAEAAKALVKFLTAPAAVPVIKQKGLEPG